MSDRVVEVEEYSEIADAEDQEQVPEVGEMAEDPAEIPDADVAAEDARLEDVGEQSDHAEAAVDSGDVAHSDHEAAGDAEVDAAAAQPQQQDVDEAESEDEDVAAPEAMSGKPGEASNAVSQQGPAAVDGDSARAAFGFDAETGQGDKEVDKTNSSHAGRGATGAQIDANSNLSDDDALAEHGSQETANQAKVSKHAQSEEPGYHIYHLPQENYVGRSKQTEGKRWKQHERNHGRDITGATNISAVTESTAEKREAYHIGAHDAYHNGDNGNRGADKFRDHYYQGKEDKGHGGSYSRSTAQAKPRPA